MKVVKKILVRETIRQMEVGDVVEFNMTEAAPTTVRTATWMLGKEMGREYKVTQKMSKMWIQVKRLA